MFVSAFVAMSSSASVGSGWGALSSLGGGADSVSLSPVYAKSYRITLAAPAEASAATSVEAATKAAAEASSAS